jgi:hypothetical protein
MLQALTGEFPYESILDWATCAIPERPSDKNSPAYLIWPLLEKCLSSSADARPDSIIEIRDTVHANLFNAALKSKKSRAALACLNRNPDFNIDFVFSEHHNFTFLHAAVLSGSVALTEALIARGPRLKTLNHQDSRSGATAFYKACNRGNLKIA